MFRLKKNVGIILSPSNFGFDTAASTFECVFNEPNEKRFYMFYSGSTNIDWNHISCKASIGVALSQDGINFAKYSGNPVLSVGQIALTPALFTCKGKYWMAFAYKPDQLSGRRLGLAVAENLLGPWIFVKTICMPQMRWEGYDIDAGPSVVSLKDDTFILFYSNVSNKLPYLSFHKILGSNYLHRQIGYVKIKIRDHDVLVEKNLTNPLKKLNGEKSAWNESVFCPGYFSLNDKHYLLPTGSIYSISFPYKQYIGLVESTSPFFEQPLSKRILIDGPKEKAELYPDAKSSLALDTPSPIIREDELWVYYAIMDRADGVWKTGLSIFYIN
ncbi:MAG: hypothetical protein NWE98_06925 [Candidatus Bathyarchaeota archaeon]|nr:hypothetical protein [Candidatus Bathyarchaeota archaeon]